MSKRDWSEKDLKKHLVEARRFMWRPKTISRIAEWQKLETDCKVVDAGCGLGFLGWTFRPHMGEKGLYLGIDCSRNLLKEAHELSQDWSKGITSCFAEGTVMELPLPDDFANLTMCQTLLMHLEEPEKALAEMVRVTKPGGGVICFEPDNVTMHTPYSSLRYFSDDELLWIYKLRMIWARGLKALGRGDWTIGGKLPRMLSLAGLHGIDVFFNSRPGFMHPPYESERQQFARENSLKNLREEPDEETKRVRWREWKEAFLAGGGSESTYYRYKKMMVSRHEKYKPILIKQMEEGEFFCGLTPSTFYCVGGFLPS